jgi:hypothetical protein
MNYALQLQEHEYSPGISFAYSDRLSAYYNSQVDTAVQSLPGLRSESEAVNRFL